MRRLALTLMVVATLGLTLVACGVRHSGVDGIALMVGGPVNPSVSPSPLPGGFGEGGSGIYLDGSVVVQATAVSGADAGKVVAQVRADARALFAMDLASGDYVLNAKDGRFVVATQKVTVHAGERTRVKLIVNIS
jgi:hypothetical protein